VIERIAAEGHTVGWHSMTHLNQWKTSPLRAWRDTTHVPPILTRGSTRAKVYRPPYGKLNLLTGLAFLKLRLSSVHWTLVSGDTYPEVPDVDDVVKALDHAGGGIILMHDMKRSGPDAEERNRFVLGLTRSILELRRQRGWKLVSATDV
jgi:peptidoglycan/xylan/chitin deacetylase (PgdA/CDA1 family)